MSAPIVDVLAVLDEAQDWLYRSSEGRGDDARAEAVKRARASVAELIGREQLYRKTIEAVRVTATGSPQCDKDRLLDITALADIALACVGGAV